MSDNMHPVDELFRLRADKGAIENRIEELRTIIIDLPVAEREGREAVATVTTQKRTRLDIEKIRYEKGQKWIDEHSTNSTVKIVKAARL